MRHIRNILKKKYACLFNKKYIPCLTHFSEYIGSRLLKIRYFSHIYKNNIKNRCLQLIIIILIIIFNNIHYSHVRLKSEKYGFRIFINIKRDIIFYRFWLHGLNSKITHIYLYHYLQNYTSFFFNNTKLYLNFICWIYVIISDHNLFYPLYRQITIRQYRSPFHSLR